MQNLIYFSYSAAFLFYVSAFTLRLLDLRWAEQWKKAFAIFSALIKAPEVMLMGELDVFHTLSFESLLFL